MTPLARKTIAALVIGALLVVSAFAGGTAGFLQGYLYGLSANAAQAAGQVSALRALRAGDVPKTLSMLENALDALIVEHSTVNRSEPTLFALAFPELKEDEAERGLFERVARYRAEFPSQSIPMVRELIDSHLQRFSR